MMEHWYWDPPFSREGFPQWPCPLCQRGFMNFQKDSYFEEQTEISKTLNSPPGHQVLRFTAKLSCQICNDFSLMVGTKRIKTLHGHYLESLFPHFILPTPHLFQIPDCPEMIENLLKESFSLYWADLRAAANRLRTAVEELLTYKKIRKTRKTKQGRQQRLSLATRIDLFSDKYRELGEALLAVKWIGNLGAHSGSFDRIQLLSAYEIMEHTLLELFDPRKEYINSLIRTVGTKKKVDKPEKKSQNYLL